jgi:alkylation response protein AidB-like acyl-CoA dehydrogenase
MLKRSVEDFVARETSRELDRELDDKEQYPFELFRKMADAGFIGHFIPPDYGGLGLGPVETVIIMETLTYGSTAASSALMPTSLGTQILLHGGTDEQRATLLPAIVRGELRVSFGLSEPHSGSDAASLKLKAERDGDGYVLNGTKMWTTGADVATHLMVAGRTDPSVPKHKGISVFIVDADAPGITVQPIKTLGSRSQRTCQVFYDNVRVDADRLLGGPEGLGQGWRFLNVSLGLERLEMAAMALGLAQRALDDAVEFVNDREAFGTVVGKFQAIQHMAATNAINIEAARALTYRAASLMAAGEPCEKEIVAAKVFSTEVQTQTCLDGVQMMGGYGYSMEFDMQRYLRRALVGTIGGGTTQVLKNVIARQIGM